MTSAGRVGQPSLRLGFRLLKGLATAPAAALLKARQEGLFRSIADVARRGHASKTLLLRLAAADAFGSFGLDAGQRCGRYSLPAKIAPVRRAGEMNDVPSLPTMAPAQQVMADYQTTGLSLKAHPIGLLRADLDRLQVVTAADLADMPDKAMVRVAGLVLVRQRPPTANGTVFMSLEDETGLLNLIIWRRTWERFRTVAKAAVALFIEGKVERAEGVVHVCPTKIDDLSHALRGITSRSRDFR